MKFLTVFFLILFIYFYSTAFTTSLGGWSTIDINSDEVKELAKKVINKYTTENEENNFLFKVIDAKQQIVAGVNYNLLILISSLSCNLTLNCSKYLQATIFQQPWNCTEEINIFEKSTDEIS
uniref:Cystatin domain-containing protein n=1 Tax=Strongyloides stercoralis TaxID=6248 RepID=A0A0K0E2Y5_STRER